MLILGNACCDELCNHINRLECELIVVFCLFQVSSGRGVISHLFNLNVLVPQAHILGAQEYHVQQGTVISLVCIIENVSVTMAISTFHIL